MTTDDFNSRCTRHIDVKRQNVRDAGDEGVTKINHIKPGEQHADVLTKAIDVKHLKGIDTSSSTFGRRDRCSVCREKHNFH